MVSGGEAPIDSDPDDLELVAAINDGDDRAFEALYRRYKEWVYQLAYRFTGDHQDAQDVLQETFTYVMRKFPGFELTSSMKTFLYPAVRNYSIAQRKKRRRAVQDEASIELAEAAEPLPAEDSELKELLQTLPASQQQVLMMRFVDGMTIPEIARALETAPGTVKSRLHYAIKSLRESPSLRDYFE